MYTINATAIAGEIGLGNRINMIMQGAFFKLVNILPEEKFIAELKKAVAYSYNKKGEKIVEMNCEAIERGVRNIHKVNIPAEWKNANDEKEESCIEEPSFVKDIMRPMQEQKGNSLPVSAFTGREDGTFPSGTTAYEKRGIAVNVPEWIIENCIQCNQCAYICPHAVIRPFLLTDEEVEQAPSSFVTKKAVGKGIEGLHFKIQISPMDCTGCGNCADVCPSKEKALVMKSLETQVEEQIENWKYACKVGSPADGANPEYNLRRLFQKIPLLGHIVPGPVPPTLAPSEPVPFPGISATMVEGKVESWLVKFGLTLEEILAGEVRLEDAAKRQLPEDVGAVFSTAKERALSEILRFEMGLDDLGWHHESDIRNALTNFDVGCDRLKVRAVAEAAREVETNRRQLTKLFQYLLPDAKPQQEVVSLLHYLNFYGPDFISGLRNGLQVDDLRHHAVYLAPASGG
jgi:ferredoxin